MDRSQWPSRGDAWQCSPIGVVKRTEVTYVRRARVKPTRCGVTANPFVIESLCPHPGRAQEYHSLPYRFHRKSDAVCLQLTREPEAHVHVQYLSSNLGSSRRRAFVPFDVWTPSDENLVRGYYHVHPPIVVGHRDCSTSEELLTERQTHYQRVHISAAMWSGLIGKCPAFVQTRREGCYVVAVVKRSVE